MAKPRPGDDPQFKRRAPALVAIIIYKLTKGSLFVTFAIMLYTLSDNNLPFELHRTLHFLHLNPERKFWVDSANTIGGFTEASVLLAALGTFIYSLFSLVEGVGMIFRGSWAGWLAIGESAFFIPIEIYELVRHPNWVVWLVLLVNVFIVYYLFRFRHRLFHHHEPHHFHLHRQAPEQKAISTSDTPTHPIP